jgi:hypothetical protein
LKIFFSIIYNLLNLIFGKIFATNFGAQGFIFFNNFRQLVLVGSSLFTFNRENLISVKIKNKGFHNESINEIILLFRNSFFFSFLMYFGLLIFNIKFFLSFTNNYSVIILFLFTILIYAINSILFSILNGLNKLIHGYVLQIAAAILSLFMLNYFMYLKIDLNLIIVAFFFVFAFILLFFNSFWIYKISNFNLFESLKSITFSKKHSPFPLDNSSLYVFSVFVIGNLLQLMVRSRFINKYTVENAGYIDGLFTASNYFSGLFVSFLTMNFIVDLTEFKNKNKKWLNKVFLMTFIVLVVVTTFMFLMAKNILILLFTDKFSIVTNIYKYFIIGDIFKILIGVSMLFALAFEKYKQYFKIALISNSLTLLPYLFFNFSLDEGIGFFYLLSNFLSFVIIYIYAVKNGNILNKDFF